MILADTSVWVEHLRGRNRRLADLLEAREILTHPFVIGEVALGHLEPRNIVLRDLYALPQCAVASDQEVLHFINAHNLFARGIGYVDAHILAATRLTEGAVLWTRDSRLHSVAHRLALAANPR